MFRYKILYLSIHSVVRTHVSIVPFKYLISTSTAGGFDNKTCDMIVILVIPFDSGSLAVGHFNSKTTQFEGSEWVLMFVLALHCLVNTLSWSYLCLARRVCPNVPTPVPCSDPPSVLSSGLCWISFYMVSFRDFPAFVFLGRKACWDCVRVLIQFKIKWICKGDSCEVWRWLTTDASIRKQQNMKPSEAQCLPPAR